MRKLAIVIGHSDKYKGASICSPFDFVDEYEFNTVLAAQIKALSLDISESVQVKVFLRDNRGIRSTYHAVEAWKADASIELHFNAFDGEAEGSLVLHGDVPESNLLAHLCEKNINEVLKNRSRGTRYISKNDRGGENVNGGRVPKVLIEPFFGSDYNDSVRAILRMHELAKAILKSGVSFLYM